MTRINSMPNMGKTGRHGKENQTEQSVIQSQRSSTLPVFLEVGSLVEVVSNTGVKVYGVVQWLGVPAGKHEEWAGIELVGIYNWSLRNSYNNCQASETAHI